MYGWKAFRTAEGHVAARDERGDIITKNISGAHYPLNVPTIMRRISPIWFCATRESACEWAWKLQYAYVAPVYADVDVYEDTQNGKGNAQKFVTKRITRIGETEPIDSRIVLASACVYRDMKLFVSEARKLWHWKKMDFTLEQPFQIANYMDNLAVFLCGGCVRSFEDLCNYLSENPLILL